MSNLEHALKHMNKDHKDSLCNLVKFHKGIETQDVELVELTYEGMKIRFNNEYLDLKYDEKADDKSLEYAVVNLCMKAKAPARAEDLAKEIDEFKRSFSSVIIASVDSKNNAISSYAPVIFDDNDIYIFISEVSEHYHSIKANPDKVEIMFIEDESKAKSVFVRIRLRYKVNAEILNRDQDFDRLFKLLKKQNPKTHVDMFYGVKDFHFVKLEVKKGRFVKGFGAAYEIDANQNINAVRINKPHKIN